MTIDHGRSASPSGYSAEPEPSCTVSAVPVSIPNAAAILLYDLLDAHEREAFAVACDGRTNRKNAWLLDSLGLARWCGTNWGSSFFAITDEGKAFIEAEVSALSGRLASAIEARRAATAETGAAHESAVLAEQTPNTGRGTSHG